MKNNFLKYPGKKIRERSNDHPKRSKIQANLKRQDT
jgi:hypothetical protein